ncbi:hypothetical protein Sfulv_48610 [Streptomyces fulvorobeus]|uniref:Uncharacterized protein n=1 Tax=Streptomyces fulvorobeus TaxID=284028 RepID=A0A7J0CC08_9ACTN|nr:hypothetical protein Sfulv_48610 [Streptomyces fulvorobeus]
MAAARAAASRVPRASAEMGAVRSGVVAGAGGAAMADRATHRTVPYSAAALTRVPFVQPVGPGGPWSRR